MQCTRVWSSQPDSSLVILPQGLNILHPRFVHPRLYTLAVPTLTFSTTFYVKTIFSTNMHESFSLGVSLFTSVTLKRLSLGARTMMNTLGSARIELFGFERNIKQPHIGLQQERTFWITTGTSEIQINRRNEYLS